MRLGIDPKNDYAFKRLFGHEHEIPLLLSLLDAVLSPAPEHRLVALDLQNPFNDKEALDDKLSILDVKARDQSGRQINIEMQLLVPAPFRARVLYYWARYHQAQLLEGQGFECLRPTISICFVNMPLFADKAAYHLVFRLYDRQHDVVFNEDIEVHILDLSRFTKTVTELVTPLDRWLYFLRYGENLDPAALPPQLDYPEIRRALEVLQKMNQTTVERERYEARQKSLHDVATWQYQLEQGQAKLEQAEAKLEQAQAELERAQAKLAEKEKAQEQGNLLGRIHVCERLLGRAPTGQEDLRRLSNDELERLAVNLEAEIAQSLPRGT